MMTRAEKGGRRMIQDGKGATFDRKYVERYVTFKVLKKSMA